jgi:hypothetical protein
MKYLCRAGRYEFALGVVVTIVSVIAPVALGEMRFQPHLTGAQRAARRDVNVHKVEMTRRLAPLERQAAREPGMHIFEFSKTVRQERLNDQAHIKELVVGKNMPERVEHAAKERHAEIYLGRQHYEIPKTTWKPASEMTLKELRSAEIQAIRKRTGGSKSEAVQEQRRRDRADNVSYLVGKIREGYAIRDIGREEYYKFHNRNKTDATHSEYQTIRLATALVGNGYRDRRSEVSKDMVLKMIKEESQSQYKNFTGEVTTFKLQKIRPATEAASKNNQGEKR